MADPALLERALANVIANALATAAGAPVRVVAGAPATASTLRVIDHGPGIPRRRARAHVRRRSNGSATAPTATGVGLGLAVARGFVEAMGGAVELEDTPGGGLTIVFRLQRPRRDRAILVVDDEPQILPRARREPRGARLRRRPGRDGRGGSDARAAPPPRRSSCSTSACPASTASR